MTTREPIWLVPTATALDRQLTAELETDDRADVDLGALVTLEAAR